MGALEGFSKGDMKHPLFNRMQRHIDEWNVQCDERIRNCPMWRKILYAAGFKKQLYRWNHRQTYKEKLK